MGKFDLKTLIDHHNYGWEAFTSSLRDSADDDAGTVSQNTRKRSNRTGIIVVRTEIVVTER